MIPGTLNPEVGDPDILPYVCIPIKELFLLRRSEDKSTNAITLALLIITSRGII